MACILVIILDIAFVLLSIISVVNIAFTGLEFNFGISDTYEDFLKDSRTVHLTVLALIPLFLLLGKLAVGIYAWAGGFDRSDLERYGYISFVFYVYLAIENIVKVSVFYTNVRVVYAVCWIILGAHLLSVTFGYLDMRDEEFRYEGEVTATKPKHAGVAINNEEQTNNLKENLLQQEP